MLETVGLEKTLYKITLASLITGVFCSVRCLYFEMFSMIITE